MPRVGSFVGESGIRTHSPGQQAFRAEAQRLHCRIYIAASTLAGIDRASGSFTVPP